MAPSERVPILFRNHSAKCSHDFYKVIKLVSRVVIQNLIQHYDEKSSDDSETVLGLIWTNSGLHFGSFGFLLSNNFHMFETMFGSILLECS